MRKKEPNHPLVPLTDEQIRMLMQSDEEIKNGSLITQEQLDEEDREIFKLTRAQKKELDRRHADFVNGTAKTYTWEETVAAAQKAVAERKNKL